MSFSLDGACSSSALAVQMACLALASGDIDTVVAGGVNMITNPDVQVGLSHGHFLSPTGGRKPFYESADGYCRTDGVACLVVKRVEDAIADNGNILGLLKEPSANHSAQSMSITQPQSATPVAIFRSMLRHASRTPADIDYIEMHGTGI